MGEPIPDFTQDERHAVTLTLLQRCMHWHPAQEQAFMRLKGAPCAVADGGKRGGI